MIEYSCSLQGRAYYIPGRMMDGIDLYVNEGVKPGGFLQAVICNDLKEAFGRADDENFHNIPAYINYFYNDAPAACWGSKEAMKAWVKAHTKRRSDDAKNSEKVSKS